jgi:biopolymer transport protein ExbD
MIDVVFLLIVFFMVVANKISERYMKLEDMPVAKNAKLEETPEPSNMFTIKDSPELGQVPYDGERPIDFSSIPKVIARDPNKPTTVRADGSVPQSVMFDVYRAIGGASQKSKVVINALERPE